VIVARTFARYGARMSSWVFRRPRASLTNVLRYRKRVVLAVVAAAMLIGWAAAPKLYRSRVLMEVRSLHRGCGLAWW